MLKLYTFNISHFSEKARWALDYEGIPYEERALLPGPHQLVTRRIARRTQVPVLEHDGQYVQGSSAIIDYVADRLGGTKLTAVDPTERAEALELEKTLDQVFGRGMQQVLYSAFLKDRRTVIDLWSFGGPFWARGFYAIAFPAVASAVKRMYKTADVEGVAKAKQRFATTFDELDALLAKQPYLGGDVPNRGGHHLGCAVGSRMSRAGASSKVAGDAVGACGSRSEPQRSTDLESRVTDVP